jgi:hypothetical protein
MGWRAYAHLEAMTDLAEIKARCIGYETRDVVG